MPPEYAAELQKLQSDALPRAGLRETPMTAELGADWAKRFASFEHHPAAAASLGQVHRARSLDGAMLACKLQYPDMQSAVEPTCSNYNGCSRSEDGSIGHRYQRNRQGSRRTGARRIGLPPRSQHAALYRAMLDGVDIVRVPRAWPELSTGRLLTLDWLDGSKMLTHRNDPLEIRNALATAMFTAWWFPFSRFGVIHGDPHLGNYTVFARDGAPAGINLLD